MAETLTIDEISRRIAGVLAARQVDTCILFGSRVRHESSRHSDIDLLLVKATATRFLDRTRDLQYELSRVFPEAPVDILCYTPTELERLKSRRFIRDILQEGKVVYERKRHSP